MKGGLTLVNKSEISAAVIKGAKALYRIDFPNGKIYFGVTNDPERRRRAHLHKARTGSEYPIYRAMRAHGPENCTMRIILIGTPEYVLEPERRVVDFVGTLNPEIGYNVLPGGQSNPMDLPAISRLVADKLRGRKNPPEVLAKKRARWTAEARAAVGDFHRGKTISDETRAKLRIACARRPLKNGVKVKRRVLRTPEEKAEIMRAANLAIGAAKRAYWEKRNAARMPVNEAREIWLERSISAKTALVRMTGWSMTMARRNLGPRGTQPKRLPRRVLDEVYALHALGYRAPSISAITGVSHTHCKRLLKCRKTTSC